ncbi:MAG: HpcH/HpaI aldolase/citrate lyase family protein [Chloroflexota bacterium]
MPTPERESTTRERSILVCPATSQKMIAKAAASDADIAIIDLEDAVAPDRKADARAAVIDAFANLDWSGKPRAFRVNAVDTPWCYRDIIEVVEAVPHLVDRIVIPKVQDDAQVAFVDHLLRQVEGSVGRTTAIRIDVQIESARGLANCIAIARAADRINALVFGPGDLAATLGMPLTAIGTPDEWDASYPGHRFGYAMHEMLVAARAAGKHVIDGPYADYRDLDGFRRSARIARALGYDGKWCIHPSQIEMANEVFSPTEAEIANARAVVAAYDAAVQAGTGSLTHAGVMVDAATVRMAESVLARAGN